MKELTSTGTRLEQLKGLAAVLADQMDGDVDPKCLASIARQYRETVREISELEGDGDDVDEVTEVIMRSRRPRGPRADA